MTTRTATRGPGGRAISKGSSASAVPMPTTIASTRPRSSWTRRGHARAPRPHGRGGARRGRAVVAARRRADVARRAARRLAGGVEGEDRRVGAAVLLVPAFAGHGAVAHDDGADHRVRLDRPPAA